VDSADAFADAPEWLIDLVTGKRHADDKSVETATPESWRTFIGEEVDGSHRASAIARVAGLLLRCAPTIDPLVALDFVRMFNALRCRPPLPDPDLVDIVTRIARRELERRRERQR
jgi:hypothetical protein